MRKRNSASTILAAGLFLIAVAVGAQQPQPSTGTSGSAPVQSTPRLMKFSGALEDASGQPLTGTVGVTFSIYSEQQGGTALWLETQNVTPDAQGHYTVLLGATQSDGMPVALFTASDPRWLGVEVQLPGEVEQPRVLLVSVPYALKASDADTVGGIPASSFVLAAPAASGSAGTTSSTQTQSAGTSKDFVSQTFAVAGTGTQNYLSKWTDNAGTLGNSVAYDNGTLIGMGTTSPLARLHVQGTTADATAAALDVTDSGGNTLLYVENDNRVTLGAPTQSGNNGFQVQTTAPAGADSTVFRVSGTAVAGGNGQGMIGLYYDNGFNTQTYTGLTAYGLISAFFPKYGTGTIDNAYAAYFVAPTIATTNYALGSVGKNVLQGLTSDSTDYALQVYNWAYTPMLYVRNDGNVGIGLNTPTALFHLRFGTQSDIFRLENSAAVSFVDLDQASRQFRMNNQTLMAGYTDEGATQQWLINSAGTTYFNGGNVGIGTNNPTQLLDVAGTGLLTTLMFPDNTTQTTAGISPAAADARYGRLAFSNTFSTSQTVNTPSGFAVTASTSDVTNNASGVLGESLGASGITYGVQGSTNSTTDGAGGIFGNAIQTSGASYGVLGQSNSTAGTGVFGLATSSSGATRGVQGQTSSTTNNTIGVFGNAIGATGITYGVEGQISSTTGSAAGVFGNSLASSGQTSGVFGQVSSTTTGATGVLGNANAVTGLTYGVFGANGSTTNGATAVYGNATGTSGATFGVQGWNASTTTGAIGVFGNANAFSGVTYGVEGANNSMTTGAIGVYGVATAGSGATYGVEGQTNSASTNAIGVFGNATSLSGVIYGLEGQIQSSTTNAAGVFGNSISSTGVVYGIEGQISSQTDDAAAVYGNSIATSGVTRGVLGQVNSTATGSTAVYGDSAAKTGITYGTVGRSLSTSGIGTFGWASAASGPTNGVLGETDSATSDFAAGVWGESTSNSGNAAGIKGTAVSTSAPAGVFNHISGGDILWGQSEEVMAFRVDGNGKGYFDGGTQMGGADFAESIQPVESKAEYEPGDVLLISQTYTRAVEKAGEPYSTRVAGVYSTKPGVLSTPYKMSNPALEQNIPVAVVGIVPCKVTAINGPIVPGDLLVASSVPGYAMKGTDKTLMLGAIVGKAMGPLAEGTGVIEVLVALQ